MKVHIGVLGLGNVGSGVLTILRDNAADIGERVGADLVVKRIAVRDTDKPRRFEEKKLGVMLTRDPRAVIDDPDVRIVVELIGGLEPAREYVIRALEQGKHVVTANKALLATYGDELFELAAHKGLLLGFEGSVAGGIPIIRTLREAMASDRIERVSGIINGTCNFILTRMEEDGLDFGDALAEAQAQGFAEADPSFDIDGVDAVQKLAILMKVGFGTRVDVDAIYRDGIRNITAADIRQAARLGYRIKLLATARRREDGLEAHVHATLLPRDSLLAQVGGAFNAVYVRSAALGPTLYYGQGAGMMPTGSAVVADIIEAARRVIMIQSGILQPHAHDHALRDLKILPMADSHNRYLLGFTVPDRPGVLAAIAGTLGEHRISIASLVQEDRGESGLPVPITIVTHVAREGDVTAALAEIQRREVTSAPTRLLRIERPRTDA